jgi:hypothetical protein
MGLALPLRPSGFRPALEVFTVAPVGAEEHLPFTLSWDCAPFGVSLFLAAAPHGPAASPGVWSPLAPSVREIHSSRVCLIRFVPPSGFLNLLTAYPSPYFATLFHAADTLGFSLQSFPLSRSRDASRRPLPSCRSTAATSLPKKGGPRRLPPSGLCSPRESVASGLLLHSPDARCSPGIPPL